MPEIKDLTEHDRNRDLIEGNRLLGTSDRAAVGFVRSKFSTFIEHARVNNSKVLITDYNKPAAAIVPVQEFRILKLLDKMGLTEKLTELTYKDLSLDQAIEEVDLILASLLKEFAGDKQTGGRNEGE